MVDYTCDNCGEKSQMYRSRFNKSVLHFCNKSCHRIFKNKLDNPSKHRDLSGKNNPMFGKHPRAWNKGMLGKDSANWKGGIHKRKDGYIRINIEGKRVLQHRHILKDFIKEGNVIHHKDRNPSNNDISNLMILTNQSQHAHLHGLGKK